MARPWLRPQREAPPAAWSLFCTKWLGLPEAHTAIWWQALTAAKWSRAVALRSTVLGIAALAETAEQLDHLYRGAMGPRELIATFEDLIAEAQLSPTAARRIEEYVLRRTNRAGQWREG